MSNMEPSCDTSKKKGLVFNIQRFSVNDSARCKNDCLFKWLSSSLQMVL